MKVHVVTQIARQVEGEYHFVNILGAFTDRSKAEKFVKSLDYKPAQEFEGIPCMVDVGILFDVEVVE